MMDQENINSSGTLYLGTLAGVSIHLHFTFVILFVVLLFSSTGTPVEQGLYMAALFLSVVAHELGHALMSHRFGISTLEVIMFPVGGVARLSRQPTSSLELWISLAGPATNFLIAVALTLVQIQRLGWDKTAESLRTPDADLLSKCILANTSLAIFNLLPAFPMDGGKALRGFLSLFRSERDASRLAYIIGRTVAIALGLVGLFAGYYLLTVVAVFVYFGAAQDNAAKLGRTLLAGVQVREAMVTEFDTLPHGATIGDAAKKLLATSQQDFPVVSGEQVVGLLSRNLLLGSMAEDGPDTYVAGAMNREFLRLPPEAELMDALPLLSDSGACGLVMDGETLLGLLTTENLAEFLVLRRIGIESKQLAKDNQESVDQD